jgi:hypothetical protein
MEPFDDDIENTTRGCLCNPNHSDWLKRSWSMQGNALNLPSCPRLSSATVNDISIYSTLFTEEMLRNVCSAPLIGMPIQTSALDNSRELFELVNGDTMYRLLHY